MKNLLHFPEFTIVNRVVPKVAFYSHLEVNARMKSMFIENVEQIVWLYKLAPSNLHIADGKEVHEITVFLVKLKSKDDSQELFKFIDSYMPRHTIFILQQEEKHGVQSVEQCQLLVNYKQWKDASHGTFDIVKTFSTDWMADNSFSENSFSEDSFSEEKEKSLIRLEVSSSMDALYESLVRQIASSQIVSSEKNLHQAVIETQEIEDIKKEMSSIKKKEAKELQPQKKFALHQQYLRLKKKLEGLS